MSKRKSGSHTAESPSPPEVVCILVVDAIIDELEVEIRCQRIHGVDRVFSTSMDWLHAERPSEGALAYSVETLLFDIVARCLRYVGEPVDVRSGLLGKGHVWAIISSVGLEMDEIKKENESWREAKIVTKAAHLDWRCRPHISAEEPGSHAVPGQTTPSNCSQSKIFFTVGAAEPAAA